MARHAERVLVVLCPNASGIRRFFASLCSPAPVGAETAVVRGRTPVGRGLSVGRTFTGQRPRLNRGPPLLVRRRLRGYVGAVCSSRRTSAVPGTRTTNT